MNAWRLKDLSGAKTLYIEKNGEHYITRHTDQPIPLRAEADDTLAIYSSPGTIDSRHARGDLLRRGRVDELAEPIEE